MRYAVCGTWLFGRHYERFLHLNHDAHPVLTLDEPCKQEPVKDMGGEAACKTRSEGPDDFEQYGLFLSAVTG